MERMDNINKNKSIKLKNSHSINVKELINFKSEFINQLSDLDVTKCLANIKSYSCLLWDTQEWEVMREKFKQNLLFLEEKLESINQYDKIINDILKELFDTDANVKKAVNNLYLNVFKHFFSAKFYKKNKDLWKIFKSYGNSAFIFLNNDFYNLHNLPEEEKFIKSLYFIWVSYYLSYIVWLFKLHEAYINFMKNNSNEYENKKEEINNILANLKQNDKHYNLLFMQAVLIWSAFSKKQLKEISKYVVKWRYKSLESAMFKILKKEKYLNEYKKELILSDQYWFMLSFKNMDDLKKISSFFRANYKKFEKYSWNWNVSKNKIYVNKYHDRGVIEHTADNKETSDKLLPFFNSSFELWWYWWIPLWEISCRLDYKVKLQEILSDYNKYKWTHWANEKLATRLLSEIDIFDHNIYKTSQELKILRKLLIDREVLAKKTKLWQKWKNKRKMSIPKKRNLEKSAKDFVDERIDFLLFDIKEKFKQNNIDVAFTDEEIKYPIYCRLKKQTNKAIIDLAYELTKHWLKQQSFYNKKTSLEKKEFLKKLSDKLESALNKWRWRIVWVEWSKKFLKIFRKRYNELLDTAIFFPYIAWEKEKVWEKLKSQ